MNRKELGNSSGTYITVSVVNTKTVGRDIRDAYNSVGHQLF